MTNPTTTKDVANDVADASGSFAEKASATYASAKESVSDAAAKSRDAVVDAAGKTREAVAETAKSTAETVKAHPAATAGSTRSGEAVPSSCRPPWLETITPSTPLSRATRACATRWRRSASPAAVRSCARCRSCWPTATARRCRSSP